jgi:Flp pilus assembly CpaE family ATPase
VSLPILTAVGDPVWEAALATGLSDSGHGVQVVRRCVDLADALAAASAGLARAVVLSADLRRLDRDALARLAGAQVAVVGLTAPDDESAERRLRQLGVAHVLPCDATPETVAAAVRAAVTELTAPPDADLIDAGLAGPVTVTAPRVGVAEGVPDRTEPLGRLLAVWGATGAPGRSTIAINLAAELAALGHTVLLVDADTYGGAVGQLLGLLDEAPGLAAACRLANNGELDLPRLAGLAVHARPALRVLTGISRPDRWLELRPAALRVVLDLARRLAAFTVVDCGFCLEQDEELSYDTAAPRRNGATLAVLEAADVVLGVTAADPVGLSRYVRALPECAALTKHAPVTVANRLRRGVVGGGEPRRQIAAALDRYAGIAVAHGVPDDREALDAALAAGRTLAEAAAKSPTRTAIRDIAVHLAGGPHRRGGRRRR